MKSILIKIIMIILVVVIINIPNTAYAMGDIISQGDSFLDVAGTDSPINEVALKTTSNYIYNVLLTIAIVLAIAIGMIIGIQFMLGSAEEQAKIKETLVPYVIGVFVVFASFTIWKIAVSIGNKVETTTTTPPPVVGTVKCDNCGLEIDARYRTCRNCGQSL